MSEAVATASSFEEHAMYASAHFGEIGINGGNFANGLFSGERTNDLFLSSSDAGIDFSLGSTTASDATSSIDFLTKATQSVNGILSGQMIGDGSQQNDKGKITPANADIGMPRADGDNAEFKANVIGAKPG